MRLPVVLLLSLMAACTEPLSNEALREDADFLDALPSTDRHLAPVDRVADDAARSTALPVLLDLAARYGTTANDYLERLLGSVDALRAAPPSFRGTNTRRWGPVQQASGQWLTLDMDRVGATYRYTVLLALEPGGPWTPMLVGEHLAGETVRDGLGSYTYTLGVRPEEATASGTMQVEYDLRDPARQEVLVELVDFENARGFEDSVFWWEIQQSGEIRFEYLAETDLTGDEEAELLEVVVRLQPDRAGRGDALVTDLEERLPMHWLEQCWDSRLDEVYLYSTSGEPGTTGDPTACAYADAARADNL